ncbi:hypothetical protein [Halobacillus sp. BBL2006]|uniref:hypothetical protein n=1 Tax=Halobacillus sp. BBL2006 TaxID=1543706 RepID=UPI000B2E1DF1|nr:hypothetical protein [Halobacillus sp. BBL2006]
MNVKHVYAFESTKDYEKHEGFILKCCEVMENYQNMLKKDYELTTLPKGIVWTTSKLATSVFSNLPIPAFTNKDTI